MTKKLQSIFVVLVCLYTTNITGQTATLDATLELKELNGIQVPYQNGMPVPAFQKQNRQIIDLKGTWKKQRVNANDDITLDKRDVSGLANLVTEAQNRFEVSYDDNSWTNKELPAVENQMNPYPEVPEFYEDGVWYRKKIDIADTLEGKFVKLMFYAVNYVADVWVNGEYIGYHEGGYTPFAFDVSSVLNYGGENTIAIRIDNPAWGPRIDIVPYRRVDWFNYTGLIHDVYLEVSNPINIVRADIVPMDTLGTVQTTVTLVNKNITADTVDVNIEIFEADVNEGNINTERASELAGATASFFGTGITAISIPADSINNWRTNLVVNNPKLWTPKDPNLYVMKVTLTDNGEVIDEYYTQFGIRTVVRDKNRVRLNGNPVFLTGVARHEDHPEHGRSIPADIIYQDMLKVKEVNANLLRTAHYPNHLQTYLLADRLGITIMEEIPVWQFDEAEPWDIQNNVRHIHEQMFREMVFKDYNSPSIIMWSTQNESFDVPNRKIYIDKVNEDYKTNYYDGRLLSQSAAADRPGAKDSSQTSVDVAGWTMYFGVFYGEAESYFAGTNFFLFEVKQNLPNKPVLATEYGYWSSENGESVDMQARVFNDAFLALKRKAVIKVNGDYDSTGYVMGVTWWCIFDWYRMQGGGYQSMGLFAMDRVTKKPVADSLIKHYAMYYNLGGMIITDVNEDISNFVPSVFELEQNFPNPFNPSTKIRFSIPSGKSENLVKLKLFDVLGNQIAVLLDKNLTSGTHEIELNSAKYNLSSGIYFYELSSDNYRSSKKMVLLK